jgi:hypothetical protein
MVIQSPAGRKGSAACRLNDQAKRSFFHRAWFSVACDGENDHVLSERLVQFSRGERRPAGVGSLHEHVFQDRATLSRIEAVTPDETPMKLILRVPTRPGPGPSCHRERERRPPCGARVARCRKGVLRFPPPTRLAQDDRPDDRRAGGRGSQLRSSLPRGDPAEHRGSDTECPTPGFVSRCATFRPNYLRLA